MNNQERRQEDIDLSPEMPKNVALAMPISVDEEERRRQEAIDLIDAIKDKYLVFFFGLPASGKTAVLGSMLNAMQQPGANGKFFIHGTGDNFFQQGLALWKNISTAFQKNRFPPRTDVNSIIQLLAEYNVADSEKNLEIVFLEMSGERLQQVMISPDGKRALPLDIDIFLKIKNIKVVFIITTAWNEAKKSDPIIDDFLTYLNEKHNEIFESRFLLLITKWDSKKNKEESIHAFIESNMPLTYVKLYNRKNIFQPFSIGNVIPFSNDGKPSDNDIIKPFDIEAGQRLFYRIYETFTGVPVPSDVNPSWLIMIFRSISIKITKFFKVN